MRVSAFRTAILFGLVVVSSCDDSVAPPVPAGVEHVSAPLQSGTAGEQLPLPLKVRALDEAGRPLRGVTVAWSVDAAGGTVSPQRTVTGTDGVAQAVWELGGQAGDQIATARVAGAIAVEFRATVHPAAPASLSLSPDTIRLQTADASVQLVVSLADRFGNEISDLPVIWSSTDTALATVSDGGLLRPGSRLSGVVSVVASVAGLADAAIVVVDMPSTIVASRDDVEISAIRHRDAPAAVEIHITEGGGRPSSWIASWRRPWIRLSQTGGTTPAQISLSVDTAKLWIGHHVDTITFTHPSGGGTPARVVLRTIFSMPVDTVPPGGVVFTRSIDPQGPEIYSVDLDGRAPRQLTSAHPDSAFWWRWSNTRPTVSPDGSEIVFVHSKVYAGGPTSEYRSSSWHLWRMRIDGSDQRSITGIEARAAHFGADWAPRGDSLLEIIGVWHFSVPYIVGSKMWIFDMRAGQRNQFIGQPGSSYAAWAPDTEWVTFNGVYIVRTDGTGAGYRLLAPGSYPDWSPDGLRIAFRGEDGQIWTVHTDGSGLTRLTSDGTSKKFPRWSPDGRQIVFSASARQTATPCHLFVMSADGTGIRQLTSGDVCDTEAEWIP